MIKHTLHYHSRLEGRTIEPNTDFRIEQQCTRYNCFCSCNGRFRCPKKNRENLCPDSSSSFRDSSSSSSRTSSSSSSGNSSPFSSAKLSSSSSSSSMGNVNQGNQRYSTTNVVVSGSNANVRGYYVNERQPQQQLNYGAQRLVEIFLLDPVWYMVYGESISFSLSLCVCVCVCVCVFVCLTVCVSR